MVRVVSKVGWWRECCTRPRTSRVETMALRRNLPNFCRPQCNTNTILSKVGRRRPGLLEIDKLGPKVHRFSQNRPNFVRAKPTFG